MAKYIREEEEETRKSPKKGIIIAIVVIIALLLVYFWGLRPTIKMMSLENADNLTLKWSVAAANTKVSTKYVIDGNKSEITVDDNKPTYIIVSEDTNYCYTYEYNDYYDKYYSYKTHYTSPDIELDEDNIDPLLKASSWKWSFDEMKYVLKEDIDSPLILETIGNNINTKATLDCALNGFTIVITSNDAEMNKIKLTITIKDVGRSEVPFDFKEGQPID